MQSEEARTAPVMVPRTVPPTLVAPDIIRNLKVVTEEVSANSQLRTITAPLPKWISDVWEEPVGRRNIIPQAMDSSLKEVMGRSHVNRRRKATITPLSRRIPDVLEEPPTDTKRSPRPHRMAVREAADTANLRKRRIPGVSEERATMRKKRRLHLMAKEDMVAGPSRLMVNLLATNLSLAIPVMGKSPGTKDRRKDQATAPARPLGINPTDAKKSRAMDRVDMEAPAAGDIKRRRNKSMEEAEAPDATMMKTRRMESTA